MPALDWITIEGFRSIKSVDQLHLKNVNVIIGSNGSGKSNFISCFSFMHHVRNGRLQEYVKRSGGADDILFFGRETTNEIKIRLSFKDETNQYEIKLIPTDRNSLVPLQEIAYFWNKMYAKPLGEVVPDIGDEAGISAPSTRPIITYVKGHLDRWRLYHFHDTSADSPLKRTSDINDNHYLRPDGSNLASFLYMLKEVYPESYKIILSSVKNVAPFFSDFSLNPLALNPDKIALEWLETGHDKFMSTASMSDGTIRFIALATLLLQPAHLCPSVILIDEPELGLHPFALSVLSSMIRYAATHSQIIVSTQSALLLDNFEPEEVLVADRVDGATVLNRLDLDSLEDWLDEYSLGQLWEKAEIGGRPNSGSERRK